MSFVVRSKSTGERIVMTANADRRKLKTEDLVCQFDDCRAPMLVVDGLIVRPHFRHRADSGCSTKLVSHPESEEHRLGKLSVATWLIEHYKKNGYEGVVIDLEVGVPEAGRVADVMATMPGGMRTAHEIQLAALTHHELSERTLSYRRAGISAVWWIGEGCKADSPGNREWLLRELGECPLITIGPVERKYTNPDEQGRR